MNLVIASDHGVPLTLVRTAKKLKEEANIQADHERDENLRYEEVWCVFDIDDHPHVPEARDMALGNGIKLAISNPCFELWILLHFRESPGPQHRSALPPMIRQYLPTYSKLAEFDLLKDGYNDAVDRAHRLQRDADSDGEHHRNPTTGVFLLTTSIAGEGQP